MMPVKSEAEERISNEIFLNIDAEGLDIKIEELINSRKTAQARVLKEMKSKKSLPQSFINKELKVNSTTLKRMEEEGYIVIGSKKRKTNPLLPILRSLGIEDFNEVIKPKEYTLNAEQEDAVNTF